MEDRGNSLSSQPYFRERKDTFGKEIVKILKKKQFGKLKKYNINFSFIQFVMNCRKWGKNSEFSQIFKEIKNLRDEIITQNLPLAISKARSFWSATPRKPFNVF